MPSQRLADFSGDLLIDLGYSLTEIVRRLRFLPPANSLRSKYAYTNMGFTAGVVAAAQSAGMSWQDLVVDKLFKPLGMTSSTATVKDFYASKNIAQAHVPVGGGKNAGSGMWMKKTYTNTLDAAGPAGGYSSSARDMCQWLRMNLSGGKLGDKTVVAANALAEAHRSQIVNGPEAVPGVNHVGTYGLGWGIDTDAAGRVSWATSGGRFGGATRIEIIPSESLGVVVLTNASATPMAEATVTTLRDLLFNGKLSQDWYDVYFKALVAFTEAYFKAAIDYTKPPVVPAPALALDRYAGAYTNDYIGAVTIEATNDKLVMRLGPDKIPYDLIHFDRDAFSYLPQGESYDGNAVGAAFVFDGSGRASSLVLEDFVLRESGQGILKRQ